MSSVAHALKEWAAVTAAVGTGDQVVLVRKGGIDEKRFDPPSERFALFPTQFHQGENQFREEMAHHARSEARHASGESVVIRFWCETVRVFRVSELDRLLALAPFVIFTEATIRDRYQFRPRHAMHVMVVRAWRLPDPLVLELAPEMTGCRSWVELPTELTTDGSLPVLDKAQFEGRLRAVESLLSQGT